MITDIPLDPHVVDAPGRPRRRWRGLAVAALASLVCGAVVLVTRDREVPPPYFVPTYLPDVLAADPATWWATTDPGGSRIVEYGHVGPDGRLDRWVQLNLWPDMDPQYEMLEERDGRRLWYSPHQNGEIHGFVDVPGCGLVTYRAVVDGDVLVAALFTATCDHGWPRVRPFAGMHLLCRHGDDGVWEIEPPPSDEAVGGFLRITAFADRCPIETASGLVYGTERFQTIAGHHAEVWVYGSTAAAVFRTDGHTVLLRLSLPASHGDADVELVKTIAGLQRVDAARWAEVTRPR